ncbi:hypothetical protein B0H14DRAFT_3566646 [Mycena olivaceomarginata]|nr:hypothetical protein B0H14DRAFT_3566646 [Mycena olivaceomarginata]
MPHWLGLAEKKVSSLRTKVSIDARFSCGTTKILSLRVRWEKHVKGREAAYRNAHGYAASPIGQVFSSASSEYDSDGEVLPLASTHQDGRASPGGHQPRAQNGGAAGEGAGAAVGEDGKWILVTIPFSRWKTQVLGSHLTDTSSIFSTMTLTSLRVCGTPDKATVNQIRAYRNYMLGGHFLGHLFFDLDNTEAWINLVAFQAYINTVHGSFNEYRTQNSTPFSSCPPSRAESPVSSCAPSRGDSVFSTAGSRPSSRASFVPASRAPSSEAPSPFVSSVIVLSDSDSDNFPAAVSTASLVPKIEPGPAPPLSTYLTVPSHRNGRKGKEKAATSRLQVTRQEAVDEIIQISSIPSTWTVPRIPAAYLVDLSNALDSLKVGNRTLTIDRFIRTEVNYPAATQALWKAELDANEREAASAPGIVSRFYNQIMTSKCKVQCNGVPVFKRLSGGASYGKQFFIGCSKWTGAQKFEHRYLPIPNNVNEDTLRIAMENDGRLPTAPTVNEMCALMVHPRIGKHLKTCPPSTTLFYGGERVSTSSPAYMNTRKVMDLINKKKKTEHPQGMGWAGVVHHFTKEASLLPVDRYLHTTMAKNGFRLAVTMHPQIVLFIHQVLSINIDFTFKRVEGNMDEWEVASMSDRFKQCSSEDLDFVSLPSHRQAAEACPDAKCRIVMLDGEVPQALGLGNFLVGYNDPEVSGINSRNPIQLLGYCLKTCSIHFERHIDELPRDIPRTVIMRLKSIMSLDAQHEIDAWHDFCAAQDVSSTLYWYVHKRANPWVLPSVNKFLSAITNESWDITPNHSNLVETAHAGRNAETSIGVGLLTAILQSQLRDNAKAAELLQIEQKGVMRKLWNGVGEREKLSAQRKVWRMRKSAVRTDQLTSFESLKAERSSGIEENKASIQREKIFQSEIKSLQDDMKLDTHRSDLREQIDILRREIEEEKDARRAWRLRQTEIDLELERIRKGPLAGIRISGRRPTGRPLEDETAIGIPLYRRSGDAANFSPDTVSEPVNEPPQISVPLHDASSNDGRSIRGSEFRTVYGSRTGSW